MKQIDIVLIAVTAGVGFMALTLMKKAQASNNNLGPFERFLTTTQPQNSNSYFGSLLNPNYIASQTAKEYTYSLLNAPAADGGSDPSQGWTVG
jgi:hypothetical protein